MEKNWMNETANALKTLNEETKKLMNANLPIDEFHKKHKELMKFLGEEEKRLQNKYPYSKKFKAIPKSNHITTHMTDKFLLRKMLNKFEN